MHFFSRPHLRRRRDGSTIGSMLLRLTNRLVIGAPLVVCLGVFAIWFSEAGSGDYQAALVWYTLRQVHDNPLLWPACVLAAAALLAWSAVAVREELRFSRMTRQHGSPIRHLGVVPEHVLLKRARRAIHPALSRHDPAPEDVIDALFGAMVDFGASELRIEPAGEAMAVVLVVGLEELTVDTMPRHLLAGLVARFRLMLALEGETGSGSIRFRSPDQTESIQVQLRRRAEVVELKLRLLSRGRPALTLSRLGLPEILRAEVQGMLREEHGLVLLVSAHGHGSTTTLYAAGHYVYRERRLRAGELAAVEPHVSLGVPFIHQVEIGAREPTAVLRNLLRADYKVLLLRGLAAGEAARLAVEAARARLVIATINADELAYALAKVSSAVGGAALAQTLRYVLAQRLVPRLCKRCRAPGAPTEVQQNDLAGLAFGDALFHPVGCVACAGRGYRGHRTLFWGTGAEAWLSALLARASGDEASIRDELRRHGFGADAPRNPLAEALRLARNGEVSADTLSKLAQRELC